MSNIDMMQTAFSLMEAMIGEGINEDIDQWIAAIRLIADDVHVIFPEHHSTALIRYMLTVPFRALTEEEFIYVKEKINAFTWDTEESTYMLASNLKWCIGYLTGVRSLILHAEEFFQRDLILPIHYTHDDVDRLLDQGLLQRNPDACVISFGEDQPNSFAVAHKRLDYNNGAWTATNCHYLLTFENGTWHIKEEGDTIAGQYSSLTELIVKMNIVWKILRATAVTQFMGPTQFSQPAFVKTSLPWVYNPSYDGITFKIMVDNVTTPLQSLPLDVQAQFFM